MKKIVLTQGKTALVDDADYDLLNEHKWYADKKGNVYYAAGRNKKGQKIYMHQVILNAPGTAQTDHINGNGLDNRRVNLRACNTAQNQWNQRLRCDNKTGFRGVSVVTDVPQKPFRVQIQVNNKVIHIGYYHTTEQAAQAYDKAALKHHGKFASTNRMLGLL